MGGGCDGNGDGGGGVQGGGEEGGLGGLAGGGTDGWKGGGGGVTRAEEADKPETIGRIARASKRIYHGNGDIVHPNLPAYT